MIKKHILIALLLSGAYNAFAGYSSVKIEENISNDKVTVNGSVKDEESGNIISYAVVSVVGTNNSTLSDIDGNFTLKNVNAGEVKIEVSMMGYKSAIVDAVVSKESASLLDVELSSEVLSLDQVVVTSSRNAERKSESAAIVSVVSPKLFTNTASVAPSDALNFGTGMRMEFNCSNCGVPQLRINGLEGHYSQVLMDSRPMFSSLAAVYGLEQMPAAMIERLEIIRGGGSALYGANAIGGVVNIITKEPVRNSFSLANQTSVLDGGATDVNTMVNGSFVSDDYRTGVYLFGNIRDRQAFDYNGDSFSDIPELNSSMVGFRAYQKIAERGRITLEYHHIEEYRRGGDALDRPPHEALVAEELNHDINGGSLKYDYFSSDYKDRVSVYGSLQNILRDSYFGAGGDLNAYGNTTNLSAALGSQWSHNFDKLWFMPSILTAGVEYTYDDLNDEMLGYNRIIQQEINTVGGYLQNEWKVEKFSALLGFRVDKHSLVDHAVFSPRVNFRYAPSDAIAFRASYAAGYRAPQAYDEDLHVAAVGGEVSLITVDENLRPEYSNSISGSVDLYKNLDNVQMNLLLEGFYTNLDDVFFLEEIGKDDQGNILLERRNGSGAYVAGFNGEFRAAFSNKLDLQAGVTLQMSRYEQAQKWSDDPDVAPVEELLRSPNTYGYLTITYPFARGFNASITGVYTGSMKVAHYAGYIEKDELVTTDDFIDMGLRLAYDIGITPSFNMELSAGVKNIFDSYQNDLDFGANKDAGYIYGPALPRSYFFGAKLYF